MAATEQSIIDFLIAELNNLPADRQLTFKGNGGWLCCPLHGGGMERTPSAMVTTSPKSRHPLGSFYCFGCHQYYPDWNTFAQLFGLRTLSQGKVREAKATVSSAFTLEEEPEPPDFNLYSPWPDRTPWRTIPGKTLSKFNARTIKYGRNFCMYLPVTVYGENRGGINCMLSKAGDTGKSYINTTGDWASKVLLGFDVSRKRRGPLWVVEGPRDTLNIARYGGRVNGLIGSKVSDEKIALILEQDPPSVLIATDPDPAGDEAAEHLNERLSPYLPVLRFPFKPDTDPADLTREQVHKAIAMMTQRYGR